MTSRIHCDKLNFSDPATPLLDGELYTGIVFDTDINGTITEETSYISGIKDGLFNEYSRGDLVESGFYKKGRKTGEWRMWDEDSVLRNITDYDHTKRNSVKIRKWDENLIFIRVNNEFGTSISQVFTKEEYYHNNGALKAEKLYEFGILLEARHWGSEGNLVEEFSIDKASFDYKYWQESERKYKCKSTFSFSQ